MTIWNRANIAWHFVLMRGTLADTRWLDARDAGKQSISSVQRRGTASLQMECNGLPVSLSRAKIFVSTRRLIAPHRHTSAHAARPPEELSVPVGATQRVA